MLFISIDFAIFLPVVFALYWFVVNKDLKLQNLLIVVASYIFYGWWDWRFLSLILLSTVIDYAVGRGLAKEENLFKRRILLFTSVAANLSFLGFFKYFNFFSETLANAFSFFGVAWPVSSLNIILPVGISFYTFQTLSYSIDVYQRKIAPTDDFIAFCAYVSFFPQLVAGPIERASNFLPQFFRQRIFNYDQAIDGMRQILWGLFKKVVIADNCATFANLTFNNPTAYSGSTLLLGAIFFALQIYGDFSGYSDMAIGIAKLFGFELTRNFAFPYFSRDIGEFWRRWHISLSSWFRSYLYIPLGGSRCSKLLNIRNTFIVFMVSGLWHGANWTFVVWGALHASMFLPLLLARKNRRYLDVVAAGQLLPGAADLVRMTTTFALTTFAWIFFRATSLGHATQYIRGIFSSSLLAAPEFSVSSILILLGLFMSIEWIGREQQFALQKIGMGWAKPWRWSFYYAIMFTILYYYGSNQQQFIYFQF